MSKQNNKHSTLEKLAWIGSFAAGFAALLAFGVLFWNLFTIQKQLNEMQRQTELENRGFLAITIDSFNFRTETSNVVVYFRYYEASRVPVVIKYPRVQTLTDYREIDPAQLKAEDIEELDIPVWHKEANVYVGSRDIELALPLNLKNKILAMMGREGDSAMEEVQNMFLHMFLRYEDITGRNYWVYMRWNLIFRINEVTNGLVIISDVDKKILSEEYLIWDAAPDQLIPDTANLPEELVELGKRFRNREFSK